jgi:integrase
MIKATTLCQCFLEEHIFELADSTRETIERAFKYFAEAVGNRRIDKIEPADGDTFKTWHLRTHRSKTTANIHLRSISWVLNWAVKTKRLIQANPLAETRQFRVTRKPVRTYTAYQVDRMVRFASSDRWRTIILVAYTTGLRRGAILNLTLDNIRDGFVYVEPKRNTARTWEWEPKDKEIRKVPIPAGLAAMITELGCFYPLLLADRVARLLDRSRRGLLKQRHRKCPEENFRRTFVAIQRRAFGRQIGDFHMLRKTFTTMMCDRLPEHFVMRLTGHSNLRTMTYYLASRESYHDRVREIAAEGIKIGPLARPETHTNRAVCA